jgi:hypothetical protein
LGSAGRGDDWHNYGILGLLNIGGEIRSKNVKSGEAVAEDGFGLLRDGVSNQ